MDPTINWIRMLGGNSPGICRNKTKAFSATDIGRFEKGFEYSGNVEINDLFMIRNYVTLGYSNRLNDKSYLNIGVGGVSWKPFEKKKANYAEQFLKLMPVVEYAYSNYTFSDNLNVSYGFIQFKYNDQSKNLGEYLFRSEAYPTVLYTGGWNWVNSANYKSFGVNFEWQGFDEKLKTNFLVFSEFFKTPIFDITPAVVAKYKPLNGFSFGGAVSLHRLITPSEDVRDAVQKNYAYYENLQVPLDSNRAGYQINVNGFVDGTGVDVEWDTAWTGNTELSDEAIRNGLFNSATSNDQFFLALNGITNSDSIKYEMVQDPDRNKEGREGYTFSGLHRELQILESSNPEFLESIAGTADSVSFNTSAIKAVGFFNLDFREMAGLTVEELGDFNLYSEIALLGIKNYPVFFTETNQRLVKMFGLSVPFKFGTFNIFDNFSIEVEHLANPNPESIKNLQSNAEIPPFPDEVLSPDKEILTWDKDDWKWSVFATRSIGQNFSIFLQVANDHFRMEDGTDTNLSNIPVTNENSHWYWLARVQFNL